MSSELGNTARAIQPVRGPRSLDHYHLIVGSWPIHNGNRVWNILKLGRTFSESIQSYFNIDKTSFRSSVHSLKYLKKQGGDMIILTNWVKFSKDEGNMVDKPQKSIKWGSDPNKAIWSAGYGRASHQSRGDSPFQTCLYFRIWPCEQIYLIHRYSQGEIIRAGTSELV